MKRRKGAALEGMAKISRITYFTVSENIPPYQQCHPATLL
jgi:hypothetical protein